MKTLSFPDVVSAARGLLSPEMRVSTLRALDGAPLTHALPARMAGSQQSALYHAEGDVWTHTMMVLREALALVDDSGLMADLSMTEADCRVLLMTALLHDVAKPATAAINPDTGEIGNPGHSRIGALMARRILWEQGCDPDEREAVASIIRYHQEPFWRASRDQEYGAAFATKFSLTASNRLLYLQALADARGRRTADPSLREQTVEWVELYRVMCEELGCFDRPHVWANDFTRMRYCLARDRSSVFLSDIVHDTTSPDFEMTILCGLPASGKSTWVETRAADQPVVSLDRIRAAMKVEWSDNQGLVRQAALEQMRSLLRKRQSFIVDATNLDEMRREPLIGLARDYGARFRGVAIECAHQHWEERNTGRADAVAPQVMERMVNRWSPPTASEVWTAERYRAVSLNRRAAPGLS